jgi:hypothetical protein
MVPAKLRIRCRLLRITWSENLNRSWAGLHSGRAAAAERAQQRIQQYEQLMRDNPQVQI